MRVLDALAGILDGHRVAGERHHLAANLDVAIVERRLCQRRRVSGEGAGPDGGADRRRQAAAEDGSCSEHCNGRDECNTEVERVG